MSDAQEKRVPLLSRLRAPEGAVKVKHRVGRGIGSGWGKTAGKGQKGQKARGTMQRRLPKIGFNNIFGVHYAPVNVVELNIFDAGSVIDEAELRQQRIVRGRWDGVKILGEGELTRAVTVKVHAISGAAREKIEKAGGTVDLIPRPNKGPRASE